jgi:hypothetical protein
MRQLPNSSACSVHLVSHSTLGLLSLQHCNMSTLQHCSDYVRQHDNFGYCFQRLSTRHCGLHAFLALVLLLPVCAWVGRRVGLPPAQLLLLPRVSWSSS